METINGKTSITHGSTEQNGHGPEVLEKITEPFIHIRRLYVNTPDYTDHENYQLLWIASGVKSITVDLEAVPFYQNTIIFLTPGKIIKLKYSDISPSGWILGFTRNFFKYHRVSQYARLMNITPKYLNQVVKRVMGVTAKSVIQEQLLIEASRDLKFSNESIKEIAYKLGFAEFEHFSNFFKKGTGITPSLFRST